MGVENNIPEGWVETLIGKVTVVESGGTPSTKNPSYWGDDISWITPRDLSSFKGVFIEKGERSISIEGLEKSSAKLLPKNTILFSSRAPIGYVVISLNEIATNQGFKNLVCDEVNSHFKYFYYLMKFKSEYIERLSSGSTFSEASGTLIKSIELKLPPLPEQKAIAKVLTAFDDKIEILQAQNKTLETMAQTIFKEWFGKYQVGDELPEGWRVGKLGDNFDITIGRTPPRKETQWFSDRPIGKKWISIKDIGNCGTFIYNTSEHLSDEAIEKFNIPIIPANTTILSFKMTVGKLTITTDDMLSNEAIAHLKIKNDSNLTSEFIYLYLRDLNFNSLGSTSSIVTAINSTIIKGIDFIIPKDSLLNSFQKRIIPVFEKIQNNTSQIQSLTKTRDTLLPKLMSGQVRVKNLKQTADA
tara:strand:- start:1085 stop:2326 length:1242 start_codon:yes stop_codon:yes gene_type:complete